VRRAVAGGALAVLLALPSGAAGQGRAATQCDPFASRACLMPFPNDMNLTVRDRSTATGVRLRLPQRAMPANAQGTRVTVAEYNRQDGFSPGQTIVVRVPGLTSPRAFRRSRLVPVDDLARGIDRRASLVVINARTRKRHPVWAELDVNAKRASERMLLIHPAENFTEGERYIVALRDLRTSSGRRIRPPAGFRALLDGGGAPRLRRRYGALFRSLDGARVRRRGLYLAWDFTVAGEGSLTGRMLMIRDDAFSQLGDRDLGDLRVEGRAPAFAVTAVRDNPDPRILRRISGTFTVPCYLDRPGCPPGARFNYASRSKDALPAQQPGNVQQARFECHIPNGALNAPARAALYGHGLLGDPDQIDETNIRDMSAEHNFAFCATEWSGMSAADVPNAVTILRDLSNFPSLADRNQQGFLNQLFLGRLLIHPQGLGAHAAFRGADGRALLDTSKLYFDGNSQGGILGAALAAIAPDYERAVLGVPGINFSVLLTRSSNWSTYGAIYNPAYPRESDRPLGLAIIQTLWDRGEGNGWAHHITADPPARTPPHRVLIHPAVGDFQVTPWQADALARTVNASAFRPAFARGRTLEKEPLFAIPSIRHFPFAGSAIVYWDNGPVRPDGSTGNDPTPLANVPPNRGKDPHYGPRTTPAARRQKAVFLTTGNVIDVCGGRACQASGATRP
jgi:hypothetical protein